MNAIVNSPESNTTSLQLPEETKDLIKASIAENTLKSYQRALQSLTKWLAGRILSDALLADYITTLHEDGKSPATIGQLVAAVKWQLKHQAQETTNFPITQTTLAGIRREGRDRGRGQVDGLIWQDVERVCVYAETEDTLAGLRDAAMIRLMSDCLLRISEVVAVNIDDLKETTLTVRSSKTDQESIGESLYVCDATRNVLNQYRERADITRVPSSDISDVAIISSQHDCIPTRHAVSSKSGLLMPVWKASSPGIPFVSDLPSPLHKPVQPSSICKSQDAGNPHKCPRIMPEPNSPNAGQSHDSKTESDKWAPML